MGSPLRFCLKNIIKFENSVKIQNFHRNYLFRISKIFIEIILLEYRLFSSGPEGGAKPDDIKTIVKNQALSAQSTLRAAASSFLFFKCLYILLGVTLSDIFGTQMAYTFVIHFEIQNTLFLLCYEAHIVFYEIRTCLKMLGADRYRQIQP